MLEPYEVRQMGVQFVIEPSLPAEINTVTISHTFFELPSGVSAIIDR